jgi:hypothetical protein
MRETIAMAAALILVGLSVSACREHPGYPSDHHRGHHDGDHDHNH